MICLVCAEENAPVTAACDGRAVHALCGECAGGYLTTTVATRIGAMPKWGELVRCPAPDCDGMMGLDMLIHGMPPESQQKVKEQIARSTTACGALENLDFVHCEGCNEYYVREDGDNDNCTRCAGTGRLTAMYVKPQGETEDDKKSEEAKRAMAISCPVCGVYINRSSGCNHMQCTRCLNHFCYVCGGDFSPAHYGCRFDEGNQAPGTGTYRGPPEAPMHPRRTLEEAQAMLADRARQDAMRRARATERLARAAERLNARAAGRANARPAPPACRACTGAGERCRHIEFMPRRGTCGRQCPATCDCEYARWVAAWMDWRPYPGADQSRGREDKERLDIAFAAVSRTRGNTCRVCGMRGHNYANTFCPLVSLVERLADGAAAAPERA